MKKTRKNKNNLKKIPFHLIAAFLIGAPSTVYVAQQIKLVTGNKNYYIDCQDGNDNSIGSTRVFPWKTLSKANSISLNPGDKILIKKGTVCEGQLNAAWNGTEDKPITIGSYGIGNRPIIQYNAQGTDNNHIVVNVTGNYQIIDGLHTRILNHTTVNTCLTSSGQPVQSGWYIGFAISGHNNTVQNSEASELAAGIFTKDESSFNKILNNYIHNLSSFWDTDNDIQPSTSLGAVGINLHGNDNEYAFNVFENNNVACTKAGGIIVNYGAPFELFNANNSYVHHNIAYGHRKHFEMGHDNSHTANDNVFAYNLLVSDRDGAKGPNVHGLDNNFGPVNGTKIYNNTVYLTGKNSEALISSGPGSTIKNNILIADGKVANGINSKVVAFYNGTYTESNNIYWRVGGSPKVQRCDLSGCPQDSPVDITSKKIDPLLTAPADSNFKLKAGSPAIDAGTIGSGYNFDLANLIVPWAGGVDIGAHEYGSTPINNTRNILLQPFQ